MDWIKLKNDIFGSRLNWYSGLYAVALLVSIHVLTSKEKWLLDPNLQYAIGVSVMVISAVMLTIETMNTFLKRDPGLKA